MIGFAMGIDCYIVLRKDGLRITQVLAFTAILPCRAAGYFGA
jgi:hypothetical protein